MKNTIFLLISFFTLYTYGQKETNIWYFGSNAGLDFNSGSPIALSDGKMQTLEGCSTISDSNGKLLFYTDGITVWNKMHQIMLDGQALMGNSSSTQSAMIVPKPNSSNIYYIFTVAATGDKDGFRYSEVDLNLDGGLGAITSNRNILLVTPSCEKVTAVKKADGSGYWVVTHGFGNSFLAYSVTQNGVELTPIVSNVGSMVDENGTIGYMKFSPDGSKLVCLHNIPSGSLPPYPINVGLYDFNNQTGVVSNVIDLGYSGYSGEFSPSGNILYISREGGVTQYDLTANDIAGSRKVIFTSDYSDNYGDRPTTIQLGPNGKIYCSLIGKNYVGAINNPEVIGIGCNFDLHAVPLAEGTLCGYGLPQFIQSYFNVSFIAKKLCFGDITEFSLNSNQSVSSVSWDFGDGTTSTDTNPNHQYAQSGQYEVSVTATGTGGITTKKRKIIISGIPTASKPEDMLVCDSDNDGFYVFNLTAQSTTILNGQDPTKYTVTYFVKGQQILNPETYSNKIKYVQEIITAEVSNNANSDCKSSTTFNIQVFDTAVLSLPANIPDLTSCDNTTVGTDSDGQVVFDLTQETVAILNGESAAQFVFSYYKDQAMTQSIVLPASYRNTSATETIFVKVANKDNLKCSAVTSFKVKVFPLPVLTTTVSLKQCDDDIDGFSYFNLEEATTKITSNATAETITFHKTLADAQNNSNPILNQKVYRNLTVSADKVYVRVTNSNNCYKTVQLNLIVSTTQIPSTYSKIITQCDDVISGTNKDGIASFDLSAVTNDIQSIFPTGQLLDITYYQNIEDALEEKNAIADITRYRNTNSPHTQKIFIRVDSKLNNDCLGLGEYITLRVEPIPEVQSIKKIHCDDNHDGLFAFDTSNLEQELLNGLTNVTVSYMDHNNNPLQSPLPNPFVTSSQVVKAVIINNTQTACSSNSTITFVVDDLPEVFAIDAMLTTVCDDELDPVMQDGKYAFDTSSFESALVGSQMGMKVNYYDSNNNPLPSPLPNPFVTSSQNVKVEVVNPSNITCTASTVIAFVVNPLPKINLNGEELVCSNLPTFTKQIDAGLLDLNVMNDYNYQWFFNGDLIPTETNYSLTVNKEGIFTVEVSDKQTQCTRTRIIKVAASDIASNIIALVDESNTISISVAGNGDYVYALDDQNGYYQDENVFLNVKAGIHTVYIKDLNGCGTVPKEVAVFGIPKFFTPNQDTHNDYWNVEGIDEASNAKTTIQIFDRYGKLLKQISPLSQGWDGTYLGTNMPSDDYWYVIRLDDNRIFKGHFALKR